MCVVYSVLLLAILTDTLRFALADVRFGKTFGMYRRSILERYVMKQWQALIPDSKVHGANMGPTCVLSAPDGPHVGPMNLAIKDFLLCSYHCIISVFCRFILLITYYIIITGTQRCVQSTAVLIQIPTNPSDIYLPVSIVNDDVFSLWRGTIKVNPYFCKSHHSHVVFSLLFKNGFGLQFQKNEKTDKTQYAIAAMEAATAKDGVSTLTYYYSNLRRIPILYKSMG